MENKLKGLTLLETMIYIGLFSIIILIVMNFMFSTQEAVLRTQRKSQLHQTAQFISQHINDTLTTANSIDPNTSVFSNEQGKLDITVGSVAKSYIIQDSKIYYDGILISNPHSIVNSFYLEPIYKEATEIIGVRISMSLSSLADPDLTENINLLAIIR